MGYYGLPDGDDTVVDIAHAYLYDPATDPATAIDIHAEMAAHHPGLFAEGSDEVPAGILVGWVIASATHINDQGVIVGSLHPEASPWNPVVRRGYVLDTHASPDVSTWTFRLLPTDAWLFSYPQQINENGDIAGRFLRPDQTYDVYFLSADGAPILVLGRSITSNVWLNNPDPITNRAAQVASKLSDGRAFRWTTDSVVPEILPSIDRPQLCGINDSGTIGGSAYATLSRKSQTTQYPMRYATSLEILSGAGPGYAAGINSAGDLITESTGGPKYLYHASWGFLNLDALIDPDDPNAAAWFSRTWRHYLEELTDRIVTDPSKGEETEFGLLSGSLQFADGHAVKFLLTPVIKK